MKHIRGDENCSDHILSLAERFAVWNRRIYCQECGKFAYIYANGVIVSIFGSIAVSLYFWLELFGVFGVISPALHIDLIIRSYFYSALISTVSFTMIMLYIASFVLVRVK